jgi:hypothetical protein
VLHREHDRLPYALHTWKRLTSLRLSHLAVPAQGADGCGQQWGCYRQLYGSPRWHMINLVQLLSWSTFRCSMPTAFHQSTFESDSLEDKTFDLYHNQLQTYSATCHGTLKVYPAIPRQIDLRHWPRQTQLGLDVVD